MADDETESAVVPPSAEEVTPDTVSANEEPMIEIPLMTGSHILKMRVSLTDFCKLPIRDIGFYNNETAANSTTASAMVNSSFCMQIGSASSCVVEGEKVVRKSVAGSRALDKLPTQIGIAESGEVRTDFPFNDPNLSKTEKKHLKMSTLMPPLIKTQPILASDTDTDVSSSFVFGKCGDPSHVSETSLESTQDPVDMSLKRSSGSVMMGGAAVRDAADECEGGGDLFPEDLDLSEDKTFPTDNSMMTGGGSLQNVDLGDQPMIMRGCAV